MTVRNFDVWDSESTNTQAILIVQILDNRHCLDQWKWYRNTARIWRKTKLLLMIAMNFDVCDLKSLILYSSRNIFSKLWLFYFLDYKQCLDRWNKYENSMRIWDLTWIDVAFQSMDVCHLHLLFCRNFCGLILRIWNQIQFSS